jgi:hypothetical protein
VLVALALGACYLAQLQRRRAEAARPRYAEQCTVTASAAWGTAGGASFDPREILPTRVAAVDPDERIRL